MRWSGVAETDDLAHATDLGTVIADQSVTVGSDAINTLVDPGNVYVNGDGEVDFVSIDDDSDIDVYQFDLAVASDVSFLLTPLGPTYLSGPEHGNPQSFDSSSNNDLAFEVLADDASTVVPLVDAFTEGGTETALDVALPAGTYFVRITGSLNKVQFYELEVTTQAVGGGFISGVLWDDLDGDSSRDAGEPGLGGRTVYLDNNDNGTFDIGEQTTTTTATGDYSFDHLPPGTYNVRQVVPPGWTQTFPSSGPGTLQLVSNWDENSGSVVAHDLPGDGGDKGGGSATFDYADVWGDGNYAYLAHFEIDSKVDIIDLSDPANPVRVATWTAPQSGMRFQDVKVYDGVGYFASDVDHGMYIVDLTDPANPVTRHHIGLTTNTTGGIPSIAGGLRQIHNVSVADGFLYQVSSRNTSIKVFDVSDPFNPSFVRTISASGSVHDVTAHDGRLYSSVLSGVTQIYDVSDVGNSVPPLLATLSSGVWTHSNFPTADNNYGRLGH